VIGSARIGVDPSRQPMSTAAAEIVVLALMDAALRRPRDNGASQPMLARRSLQKR
jgi:hypothetical protein